MLLYQSVTCDSTRFCEARVRLGPTFDKARLAPSMDVDHHQRGPGVSRVCGAEPLQGSDAADTVEGYTLPLRRFEQAGQPPRLTCLPLAYVPQQEEHGQRDEK
jgi:hypothetical protein